MRSALEIRPDYLPFGRPSFSEEEIFAIAETLRSGWVGMGAEVHAFERELASFLEVPRVVLVSSCTAALHLSLAALGVGSSDEVVCPSFTWCSSANAALYLGARVVFCDVDRQTWCVSPETVAAKLSSRTKAVILVHFGGRAIDIQPLLDILPDQVQVIEDAAHAFGAEYPAGGRVGSSGRLTCFSFYANKNLSTAEGGAVALADEAFAERLCRLRHHGQSADAWQRFTNRKAVMSTPSLELGFKANYTDLQASIGRVQLRRFPELQRVRREVAAYYLSRLQKIEPRLVWQQNVLDEAHALHLLAVLLPLEKLKHSRDEIVLELRRRNIGATIHYAPLHGMPYYEQTLGRHPLPNTEFIAERIMTLPISSSMTQDDARYVCDHFVDILQKATR